MAVHHLSTVTTNENKSIIEWSSNIAMIKSCIKLHTTKICCLVACRWACYEIQYARVCFLSVSTHRIQTLKRRALSTQNDLAFKENIFFCKSVLQFLLYRPRLIVLRTDEQADSAACRRGYIY